LNYFLTVQLAETMIHNMSHLYSSHVTILGGLANMAAFVGIWGAEMVLNAMREIGFITQLSRGKELIVFVFLQYFINVLVYWLLFFSIFNLVKDKKIEIEKT